MPLARSRSLLSARGSGVSRLVFAAFRDGVQRCALSGVCEESRFVLLPFVDGVKQPKSRWGSLVELALSNILESTPKLEQIGKL